jgi:hypothetical protein
MKPRYGKPMVRNQADTTWAKALHRTGALRTAVNPACSVLYAQHDVLL